MFTWRPWTRMMPSAESLGEAAEERELLDGEALGYGSPCTGQTDGEAVLATHLGMQIGDDFLAHGEQGEKPEPAGQVGADVGEYAYEVVAYARMVVYEPGSARRASCAVP